MNIHQSHSPLMPYLHEKKHPKQQVAETTCTCRYLGRFIVLGIYVSVALFLWHTLTPTRSEQVLTGDFVASQAPPVVTKNVVIYAATNFFGHPVTTERFLATCPDVQDYCRISQDESESDNADAILFHNADYRTPNKKFQELVQKRKPGVPFVLWSEESPSNDHFRPESHMINWTMTYRRDSDVFSPYGTIVKLESPVKVDLNAIWDIKKKTATWLASNCHTQNHRFDLIKKMMNNGFDIDVWGNCGKQPGACNGVDNQESPCVVELIKPYKFYMSLENSNCKDYVTEKFWKALNDRMTVPIVLSRKYYKDLGVPDSAYIAVDDYATFDEFMNFLKKVNDDKELYLKYHEWRKTWKVIIGHGFSGWCTLCHKLQDKDYILKHPKSYRDVAWWHSFEMCDNTIADKYIQ